MRNSIISTQTGQSSCASIKYAPKWTSYFNLKNYIMFPPCIYIFSHAIPLPAPMPQPALSKFGNSPNVSVCGLVRKLSSARIQLGHSQHNLPCHTPACPHAIACPFQIWQLVQYQCMWAHSKALFSANSVRPLIAQPNKYKFGNSPNFSVCRLV